MNIGKNAYGVPSDGKSIAQFNPGEVQDSDVPVWGDADEMPSSKGSADGHADMVPSDGGDIGQFNPGDDSEGTD